MTLEGIFLAIRVLAEKSLTDSETGRRFVIDWMRMANAILSAASEGVDPFATPFIALPVGSSMLRGNPFKSINRGLSTMATGVGFLREQAFLANDLDKYRDDVLGGQKWLVRFPGESTQASGLFLSRPKCMLFKYWTRSQCPPPMDGPYSFVAVALADGKWVFSTDRAHKVSLKPLAASLQAAERKQMHSHADRDPWFDGQSFQTAVAASPQAGTRLSEHVVLGIVKKWCRARPLGHGRQLLKRALVSGCVAALLIIAALFGKTLLDKKTEGDAETATVRGLADIHDVFVLSVGISNYKNLTELPNAAKDAEAIAAAFKKQEGRLWNKVSTRVLKDEQATRADIIDHAFGSWLLEQQTPTTHSLVIITFSGHGFIEAGTNRYHFAPQDYDRLNQGSSGIFFTDLQRYLGSLPCTVILVFDTCHSGALNEAEDGDPSSPDSFLRTIQKSVKDSHTKNGMIVMAACARYQKANETQRWGHGALALALLEGMDGSYRYDAKNLYQTPLPKPTAQGMITLREMDRYIADQVEILSSEISSPKYRRQAAKTFSAGISLEEIAICKSK